MSGTIGTLGARAALRARLLLPARVADQGIQDCTTELQIVAAGYVAGDAVIYGECRDDWKMAMTVAGNEFRTTFACRCNRQAAERGEGQTLPLAASGLM